MCPDGAVGSVRFDDVTKTYALGSRRAAPAAAWPFGNGLGRGPHFNALDSVSLDISPGESFALVGANGAGKSTALKILAGVVEPTIGEATSVGRVLALIELGIGFHGDLSGTDNARFAATLAGLRGRAREAAVKSAIEFAELDKFASTPVKRYSSGMYARLSFGVATVVPFDILVIDEVLSVGDLAFQRKAYSHLREVRARDAATLLFVSHNDWVLKEMCQRGALLIHGEVDFLGPIDELLRRYHGLDGARPDRPLVGRGQEIRFHSVDTVPTGRRSFDVDEKILLEIDCEVSASVDTAAIGVVAYDSEGRLLWASYSDDADIVIVPGRRTLVLVEVERLGPLPGHCRLEVFAVDRANPLAEDHRIFEMQVTGDVPSRWEHGIVRNPAAWDHRAVT